MPGAPPPGSEHSARKQGLAILSCNASDFDSKRFSPRYLKIAGRWRDHERWAITREDWKKRQLIADTGLFLRKRDSFFREFADFRESHHAP